MPDGLRRRVRGATLNQPERAAGAASVVPSAPLPLQDAEQVRSSLEEFEEAVSRAERESTLTDLRITEHTASHELPEGVGP